jgi:hypothetical protein
MGIQQSPSPSDEQFGLEVIDGLGASSAARLRSAGVRTLADLARFSDAHQLFEHLRAHGVSDVPLARILNERGSDGDWVAQAHRRQGGVWVVDFEVDRTVDPPRWTTTVSSDEPQMERRFESAEPEVWATWLVVQSGLPAHTEDEDAAPSEESWLRVTSFDVVQPEPNERGHPTLMAEVEVGLSGGGMDGVISNGHFFVVDLVAVPEGGGPPQRLGTYQERFAPGAPSYSVTLTFPVPRTGSYHLYCVAFSPTIGLFLEGAFGPALRVVERSRADSELQEH